MASWDRRLALSCWSAATSSGCICASDAEEKSPAMPGNIQHSKQKPAVNASAAMPGFRNCSAVYPPFSILSRTMNPSIGNVTCKIINAMDTVLNLL
ncbi:unknown [Bacteroides sp. CAG:709]|nr:unknown [Bacteroides sp. CAG:709]